MFIFPITQKFRMIVIRHKTLVLHIVAVVSTAVLQQERPGFNFLGWCLSVWGLHVSLQFLCLLGYSDFLPQSQNMQTVG